jgi:arylsulfatase
MEEEMDGLKRKEAFKKNLDLDRIRGRLNQMIDDRMLEHSAP